MGQQQKLKEQRSADRVVTEYLENRKKKIRWTTGIIIVLAVIGIGTWWGVSKKNSPTITGDGKTMHALIKTTAGEIAVDLYPDRAPKTVENFVKLSKEKFYDGVTWHRVVDGFVIQGGDPNSKDDDLSNDGQGGPGYKFEDEINPWSIGVAESQIAANEKQGYKYRKDLESLKMEKGVLAMANSGPATNGSQFFIVTESAQPHLDGKHTVFGKVVSGMDVVLKVKQNDVIQSIEITETAPNS